MNSKNGIIALIVFLSLLVVGLTYGMIAIMNNNFSFNFIMNFNDSNATLVESFDSGNETVESIIINTFSTDIEFKESDSSVRAEYYSNSEKNPKFVFENNHLILNEKDFDISCIGFCNERRKLVLYIPSTFEGEIKIETSSGDINSLTNINNIEMVTSSGDIVMSKVNNVSIKTSSGDINIASLEGSIELRTSSGDIVIGDFNIKENSTIDTSSGDVYIKNNVSNCYVDASTSSGDAKITKFDRKSDLVLEVKTSSGDIVVN